MALVAIQDTIKDADGNLAQGKFVVENEPFITSEGIAVAKGALEYTLTAGVVNISLFPGSYRVTFNLTNGARYVETWIVPATGPVTVREIRQY